MSKVIDLRTAIVAALRSVHPRVYYERAPEGAQYPYLVYNLPNSINEGALETFVLDVDGWDVPEHGDTTAIELLMDGVDQVLHKRVVNSEGVRMVIYRDRRFPIEDDDKRIVRRKGIFEVRTIQKRSDYHYG